jgi:aconitate hydratase
MYLGIRCVIAKSFARIHVANLINAGILPLTFADPADYDALTQGAKLHFRNLKAGIAAGTVVAIDETTGKEILLKGEFTQRQQQILLCGGLLNYTKENG